MKPGLLRRSVAEFVGTLFLLATVVGSGIMGEKLAGGNVAIALLANTIAAKTRSPFIGYGLIQRQRRRSSAVWSSLGTQAELRLPFANADDRT